MKANCPDHSELPAESRPAFTDVSVRPECNLGDGSCYQEVPSGVMLDLSSLGFRLMSALAIGLLIGTERERRKGEGPSRSPAGIRTFVKSRTSFCLFEST